jgi:hypothetical protein
MYARQRYDAASEKDTLNNTIRRPKQLIACFVALPTWCLPIWPLPFQRQSRTPAPSQAGRPCPPTTTQDLIAQREKWGSSPGATGTAAGEPPPPEKAVKPAPSGRYAVLPTESTEKLIAEREKWGKGPAGYEKKQVAAPRAAGAGKKS